MTHMEQQPTVSYHTRDLYASGACLVSKHFRMTVTTHLTAVSYRRVGSVHASGSAERVGSLGSLEFFEHRRLPGYLRVPDARNRWVYCSKASHVVDDANVGMV